MKPTTARVPSIANGGDAQSPIDPTIDELAPPNERTYRCVLKDLEGSVVETTYWKGDPPEELFTRDGARRFERKSYRPRVLMVVYEERTNET